LWDKFDAFLTIWAIFSIIFSINLSWYMGRIVLRIYCTSSNILIFMDIFLFRFYTACGGPQLWNQIVPQKMFTSSYITCYTQAWDSSFIKNPEAVNFFGISDFQSSYISIDMYRSQSQPSVELWILKIGPDIFYRKLGLRSIHF